ncbi:MAG TPA: tRNA (adenosine(37)-N6)-dimethylallyltransferase MiaA [Candidatus Paceibacterota bacterium]|nr:tRNA (adenosine(37)-N6)-dimethylallyltransferase MiaA [Candidatus Paceibacterota bacterium]
MSEQILILCIIGPTASGKSGRAVEEALARSGEVISVDSRQVYTMLDIGSEKISEEEMRGVPHHLMSFVDPRAPYSAGDFVKDAAALIKDIHSRGKLPILAGGTLFYFDALLNGLPEETPPNEVLRRKLEPLSNEALYEKIKAADPGRAEEIDPDNRRRLIRAIEIIEAHGTVPKRKPVEDVYKIEWVVIDPPADVLRSRIDTRLESAFARGLIEEVRRVRDYVGDARLNELGLEYRVVGEYLRGERTEDSLLPALSAKLWQYARRQKAWIRKLMAE